MPTKKEIQQSINKRNYKGSAVTVDPKVGLKYPTHTDLYVTLNNYPKAYDPIGMNRAYLRRQHDYNNYYKNLPTAMSDYNDPTQINSMADVVLASFNSEWGGNIFQNWGTYFKNTVINPIAQGNFGAFAINRLIDLGETLDIVANPVKGLVLEGREGFKKSLGIGHTGRYNYDYDTGNIVTDIVLELISDPLNWVTLFGKSAATALNIGDTQKIIRTFLGETGNEVADKSLRKVAKNALNSFWSGDATGIVEAIYKSAQTNKATRALMATNPEDIVKGIQRLHDIAKDSASIRTVQGLQKIITPVEKFETGLLKTALTGGLTPAADIIGKGKTALAEFIGNKVKNAYKPYVMPDGNLSFKNYAELKEAADNQMLDLTSAIRLTKDGTVPPDTLHGFLRDGFLSDINNLRKIIKDNWNDPGVILSKINEYYKVYRGVDNFALYIDEVIKVNKLANKAFQDVEETLLAQFDFISELNKVGVERNLKEALVTRQKKLKTIAEGFSDLFEGQSKDITRLSDTQQMLGVDVANAAIANLEPDVFSQGLLDVVSTSIKRAQTVSETRANVWQGINDYFKEHFNPILRQLHNETLNDAVPWYRRAIVEFEEMIAEIKEDYLKPVHASAETKTAITADMFSEINAAQRVQDWFDKWDELVTNRIDAVTNTSLDNKTFATIDKWLESAVKTQTATLEKIIKTQLTSMKPTKKVVAEYATNFKKAQKAVKQFFGNDLTGWFEQFKNISKNLDGVYDEGLIDSMQRFLYLTVDDHFLTDGNYLNELWEVWTEVRNGLHKFETKYSEYSKRIDTPSAGTIAMGADTLSNLGEVDKFIDKKLVKVLQKAGATEADEVLKTAKRMVLSVESGKINNRELAVETITEMIRMLTDPSLKSNQAVDDALEELNNIYIGVMQVKKAGPKADFKEAGQNLQDFLELVEAVDNASPFELVPHQLTLESGKVFYQLKLEQAYTSLAILRNEELSDIVQAIVTNTDAGRWINNMARVVNPSEDIVKTVEACQQIVQYAKNYDAYHEFLTSIVQAPLTEIERQAVLSSIQNFARLDPKEFMDNFDYYYKKLLSKTEDYMNTTYYQKRSLSIEELAKQDKYKEWFMKEYGEEFKAHGALHDIRMQRLVMMDELEETFSNPDARYIIFDYETTALSASSGSILEFAAIDFRTGETLLNIKRALRPDEQTMNIAQRKLLTKFDPSIKEYDEQVEAFLTKYTAEDGFSEEEILTQIVELYQKQSPTTKFVGHGSDNFDLPFQQGRIRLYDNLKGRERVLNNFETIDTLKLLREKDGFVEVQNEQTLQMLRGILYRYGLNMEQVSLGKFINPSTGDLAKLLMDISQDIQRSGKVVAGKQVAIAAIDDKQLTLAALADLFYSAGNSIYSEFQSISAQNSVFKGMYITKEIIQNMEKGGLLKPGELPLTLSQLLFKNEGVNYLGYKRAIDPDAIMNYFKFNEGDTIDHNRAVALTTISKGLDNAYKSIRNPARIAPYSDEIKTTLQKLQGRTDDMFTNVNFAEVMSEFEVPVLFQINPLLTAFRVSDDVRTNYAMLQYVYRKLSENKKLTDDVAAMFDPKVLELLENPKLVTDRAITAEGLSYTDKAFDIGIDEAIGNPKEYARIMQEWDEGPVKTLRELSEDLDNHELVRASAQAASTALQPMQKLLDYFKGLGDNLPYGRKIQLLQRTQDYTNNLAQQQLISFLSNTPEQMRDTLIHYAPLGTTFSFNDVMQNKMFLDLLQNQKALNDVGLNMLVKDGRVYITLQDAAKVSYKYDPVTKTVKAYFGEMEVIKPELKELDLEFADTLLTDFPELAPLLKDVRDSIHRFSEQNSVGTLGDATQTHFYKNLFEQMPDEIRKTLPDIDSFLRSDFFKKTRYNWSNLGSLPARRELQGGIPNSIVTLYKKSSEYTVLTTDAKLRYMSQFNPEWSINVGRFAQDQISDDEVLSVFQNHPEYVLAGLVENKKYGVEVVNLTPRTEKGLRIARELNAVVVPRHTFNKMYETINSDCFNEGFLKFMNNFNYAVKVGMLFNPAMWFRNYVDSTAKTMVETQTFLETFKKQAEAAKAIKTYDNAVEQILGLSQFNIQKLRNLGIEPEDFITAYYKNKENAAVLLAKYDAVMDDIVKMDNNLVFLQDNMDLYFNKMNPNLDKETFLFLHTYFVDGPSAGRTGAWNSILLQNLPEVEGTEKMWRSFVHVSKKMMAPNQWIEQINRLAEYMIFAERGLNTTETFYRIAKTHFDAATKSSTDKMIELFMPFYTFAMKNAEFWIDAISSKPWLASMLRDVMTPIWNFNEIPNEELKRNHSLQYQILSGAVPLNDKGLTLKLSASFMDTFNLITDPVGSMYDKLSPYAGAVTDTAISNMALPKPIKDTIGVYGDGKGLLDGGTALLPLIGPALQRYTEMGPKYFGRSGNLLNRLDPSLFGATLRYGTAAQSKGSGTSQRTMNYYDRVKLGLEPQSSSRKKRAPKRRKTYHRKTYAKKYYPKYIKQPYRDKATMRKAYSKNSYMRFPSGGSTFSRLYTKKGASKFKLLNLPTTPKTLKYKLKVFYSYFR